MMKGRIMASWINKIKVRMRRDPRIKVFLKYHRKTKDPEILSMMKFMKKHNQFNMMNCELSQNYNADNIIVNREEGVLNSYVMHEGKKLYFTKNKDEVGVKNNYIALAKEQDKNSPHCYLSEQDLKDIIDYKKRGGYIRLFEFGTAEGMFSLKLSELVDEIHLFECKPEWIEALQLTFSPWKEKVSIINKYVTDKNDDNSVSLDEYLSGKPYEGLDIVKMDIEGAEIDALHGMKNFLRDSKNFKLFVCVYHNQEDEKQVKDICKNFDIETNKGYFCFYEDPNYGEPYVRRCLLKISK